MILHVYGAVVPVPNFHAAESMEVTAHAFFSYGDDDVPCIALGLANGSFLLLNIWLDVLFTFAGL